MIQILNIDEAITYWKNLGIPLNAGVSMREILDLEIYLNFIFPNDFKELYLKINGFTNWELDRNGFSMMPLEIIKEIYDDLGVLEFIPFYDYLINCHHNGFSKAENGIFIDYRNNPTKLHNDKVSDTFIGSLSEIISNSDKAY